MPPVFDELPQRFVLDSVYSPILLCEEGGIPTRDTLNWCFEIVETPFLNGCTHFSTKSTRFGASWTMTHRPVFLTELTTVSLSQGTRVCRSMSSQSTPDSSIALEATCTIVPHAITVHASPSLTTSACSRGMEKYSSGTSPSGWSFHVGTL